MKLKERFNTISCKDCAIPYCDSNCTMLSDRELNKLEQIANDYAIEFAEWCAFYICKSKNILGDMLHAKSKYDDMYTSKELLEIYKKEKGL